MPQTYRRSRGVSSRGANRFSSWELRGKTQGMQPSDPFDTVLCVWPGGPLSFVEHVGLASFRTAGATVRIVSYAPPAPLPGGVVWEDAARYLPPRAGLAERLAGPSCDRLRFALLRAVPGALVVEPGLCRLAPFVPVKGRLFGWANDKHIGLSAVALPPDSPALAALGPREDGTDRSALGAPALTRAVQDSGEMRHALPRQALTPVLPKDRRHLIERGVDEAKLHRRGVMAVTLHAEDLRRDLAAHPDRVPSRWSMLGRLMARFDVRPEDAPIP
ncbi:MAG: hypothetical protein AAFQ51_18010 [Pseudomonadota bacterium]